MSVVLHINGWPGTGKLTIARQLARHINAKLIDNHTLINPAECLFERDNPNYWPLRKEVRKLVLAQALKLPVKTPIIFTDALADDAQDIATLKTCEEFAAQRRVPILAAILDCDETENLRRMVSPGRSELLKLTDTLVLQSLRSKYRLLMPTWIRHIEINVSALTASEVATALQAALGI